MLRPMSAFICNTQTYNNIYSGLKAFKVPKYPWTEIAINNLESDIEAMYKRKKHTDVISAMRCLNVIAVNFRYDEKQTGILTDKELLQICTYNSKISIEQFLKSLECWLYQTNVGSMLELSSIYSLTEALISAIARDLIHATEQYKAAIWQ